MEPMTMVSLVVGIAVGTCVLIASLVSVMRLVFETKTGSANKCKECALRFEGLLNNKANGHQVDKLEISVDKLHENVAKVVNEMTSINENIKHIREDLKSRK